MSLGTRTYKTINNGTQNKVKEISEHYLVFFGMKSNISAFAIQYFMSNGAPTLCRGLLR